MCYETDVDDEAFSQDDVEQKVKVKVDRSICIFLSKRNNFHKQLQQELETLSAYFELVPNKTHIIVTKRPGSKCIKNWSNRSVTLVQTFCNRFVKESFFIKDAERLRKDSQKLYRTVYGNAFRKRGRPAVWVDGNDAKVFVISLRENLERDLEIVRNFLSCEGRLIDIFKFWSVSLSGRQRSYFCSC